MPARRCPCRQAGDGRRDRRRVRCRSTHHRQAQGRRRGRRASFTRRCSRNRDAGGRPPTPAMKRFADSVARQKGIKPPPATRNRYRSAAQFLTEHAPKKADGETVGKIEPKPVSRRRYRSPKRLRRGKGLVIPDETKASSAAMSAWIESNLGTERRKGRRKSRQQAGGINCASIDSANEEASETQS